MRKNYRSVYPTMMALSYTFNEHYIKSRAYISVTEANKSKLRTDRLPELNNAVCVRGQEGL